MTNIFSGLINTFWWLVINIIGGYSANITENAAKNSETIYQPRI